MSVRPWAVPDGGDPPPKGVAEFWRRPARRAAVGPSAFHLAGLVASRPLARVSRADAGRPTTPCRCGGGHRAGHGSRSRVMPLGWLFFSPLRRLALLGWLVRSLARGWYYSGGRSAVARRGRAVRRVKIDQARVSWHGSCLWARVSRRPAQPWRPSCRVRGVRRGHIDGPPPAASERITLTSAACAPGAAIPRRLGRRRGALAAAVARPARRDPLASAAAPGSQRSGRDLRALAPSR